MWQRHAYSYFSRSQAPFVTSSNLGMFLLGLNLFPSADCVVDVWETCRVSLGIGSRSLVTTVHEARADGTQLYSTLDFVLLCNTALRPTDCCTFNCNIYRGRFTVQGIKELVDLVLLTGLSWDESNPLTSNDCTPWRVFIEMKLGSCHSLGYMDCSSAAHLSQC